MTRATENNGQLPQEWLRVCRDRVKQEPEAVFATWLDDKGKEQRTYTYGEVWRRAGCIAHAMRVTWGLARGDRVILCYDFGLEFFVAFLGCLRAGRWTCAFILFRSQIE